MTKTRTGRLSRLIAVLLMVIMICSMLPMTVFADGPEITSWAELQRALNAGGSVTLTRSITAGAGDTALTVPVGVTVTLDLNGFTLDRAASSPSDTNRAITVYGNLSLQDSSANKTGTIKGGRSDQGSGVYVAEGASFTMSGGLISGSSSNTHAGGGVYVAKGAQFTMHDGTIANFVLDGYISGANGAVYLDGGVFDMHGGEISDNWAEENGGGVYMDKSAVFTMYGGSITRNTSGDYNGPGVYMTATSTFTMKGGEITDCSSGEPCQSCVYVSGKSNFFMEDGKISKTMLDDEAMVGVRVTTDSFFTMSGGKISGYHYEGVENSGTFTMSGGKISGNLAGGVANYGTINMSGGEISDNGKITEVQDLFYAHGGGVYMYDGTFNMSGGKISENTLLAPFGNRDCSAGVWVNAGTFTMSGGEISDNTSETDIGGVGLGESGIFQVSGTPTITGNKRSNDQENNVNLKDGQYIDVTGELKDGADIGVTTPTEPTEGAPVEFTREYTAGGNNDDPARFFTSDAGYDVRLNDNRESELYIGAPGAVLTYGNDGNGTISDADVRFIGDADCDNDIDIDDVSRLYDIINGRVPTPTSDSREYVNADTNGDGEFNITDVLNIHAVLDKRMPLPNAAWTFTVNDTPNAGYFVSKVTYNSTDDLTKAVELNLPTGSGTETTTIEGITYTVSVDANGVTTVSGSSLALNDVRFEHEPKPTTTIYGDLVVTKTVAGNAASTTKEFTFTVTLSDTTISGPFGDMTFVDGVAEFTLKHNESKTATGLPAGITYEVKEADYSADGYVTTKTGDSGKIAADGTATAAFTNTKTPPPPDEPETGDLTVSKTVAGEGADQNKEFSFTVTLSDTTINGTYGDMTFAKGIAEFTLKDGESKKATGLPEGITYEVTEADYSAVGYVTTKTGETGKISANGTATAAFTNTKTPPPPDNPPDNPSDTPEYGSLTVKKTVTGNLADKEQYFNFTITFNAEGSYSYTGSKSGTIKSGDTVQLKHGESITISGLPAGTTYEVTESGNDGYKVYSSGDKGTIAANATSTAAFTNSKSSVPQTGDDSNLLLWLGIAGVSGLGMLLTTILGKKRKGKHIASR